MVIQRIQSLLLGGAAALIFILTFIVPIGSVLGLANVYMTSWAPLLTLNLVTAILAIVSIFLYNNLPLQIKLVKISIVMAIASAVIFLVFFVFRAPMGVEVSWILPLIFYAVAGYLLYRGYLACEHDRKLLEDSKRLI